MVAVGEPAPDFDLPGVDGRTGDPGRWSLSALRGRPVVLAFYPADRSPVCKVQLRDYTAGIGRLDDAGAHVLAISPQSPESHRRFAESEGGFGFPLLSDEDRSVGRRFGILGLLDLYRRSVFVIDREGDVTYAHRAFGPGLTFRPVDEIVAAVAR